MITRRCLVLTREEVEEAVKGLYEGFCHEALTTGIGTTLIPKILMEKGVKNLTNEELVYVVAPIADMRMDNHNEQNPKDIAIAVLMFVPDSEGQPGGNTYLIEGAIFKKDFPKKA